MAILRIRDDDGNVQEILAIKGEKGDKGDPGEFAGGELLKKHINDKDNPHGVTRKQIGALSSESTEVDNWSDATENGFYYGRGGTPDGEVWFGIVSNAPDNRCMQLIWRERTADEIDEDAIEAPKVSVRYYSGDMEIWGYWYSIDFDVWERVSWLLFGGEDFDMRYPATNLDIDNWIYIGGTNSEEYMCAVSENLSAEDMMMYIPCPFDSEEYFHNIQITVNGAELLTYAIEEGELIVALGTAQESGNIPVTVNVRTYCSSALY